MKIRCSVCGSSSYFSNPCCEREYSVNRYGISELQQYCDEQEHELRWLARRILDKVHAGKMKKQTEISLLDFMDMQERAEKAERLLEYLIDTLGCPPSEPCLCETAPHIKKPCRQCWIAWLESEEERKKK